MATSQSESESCPKAKRPRRHCHFDTISQLVKLITGLISIPSSNADSERGFSILRNIHTDQRLILKQSTLISLMSIKFNSEECCHDSIFSELVLTYCKKATVLQNKQ